MSVASNVASIRHWLNIENVSAIIIPSTDPHNSEYTPDHWKAREWATGFTGSAGTAVITKNSAALWTDSRYFIQATQQLEDTPYVLMKDGMEGTPTIIEWLESELEKGDTVAFVGEMVSIAQFEEWTTTSKLNLQAVEDPFDYLWRERPATECQPMRIHYEYLAGESVASKLERIRQAIGQEEGNYLLMNDLSEIAWTLNLRGADVEYNPVFLSYLLVYSKSAILFVDKRKLTPEVNEYLKETGVKVRDYNGLKTFIADHNDRGQYYMLPQTISYDIVHYAERLGVDYDIIECPVETIRMTKNPAEQEGFRRAMENDGVAMVKFLRWLDENVPSGNVTELDAEAKLNALRQEHPEFRGFSFAPIVGYAANGAIVHREASPEDNSTLLPKGLLLCDSGAHYRSGTTDITRTIALGAVTEEERKAYTLVLKGHIALSKCCFPEGTTGIQLDLAARYAMWQHGYDFGHGTGHGVGSRLCVHEGPHQIRKNVRPCSLVPFKAGMTITNEPGIYAEGKFGVRIENLLLTIEKETTPFGKFLAFETLTLCPIDVRPIDFSMLSTEEKAWLNDYHELVRTKLMPLLTDAADQKWLEKATARI
ncbi:MAG: aminopeptidase P family protein [Bacteroidaceae bacterium]|jgi:Xaa-Pro aminopeptidase|nr:aminopeptidase P family protein [Bacteroidaceae bacterium]